MALCARSRHAVGCVRIGYSPCFGAPRSLREEKDAQVEFTGPVAWAPIAVSLSFAVALFFLLPTFAARLLAVYVNDDPLVDALFEGVIRLLLFIAYLWVIGRFNDIRRVFGYHGAEHKTINAYEAGAPLTVAEVQKFSVQHTLRNQFSALCVGDQHPALRPADLFRRGAGLAGAAAPFCHAAGFGAGGRLDRLRDHSL